MDYPVCRLCGHKHAGIDHVFDDVPKSTKPVVTPPIMANMVVTPAKVVVNADTVVNSPVNLVVNKSRTQDRHKNTEARRLYIKDKMRVHRMKAKAAHA